MAGKACHVVASATQVGLTQALGAHGGFTPVMRGIETNPAETVALLVVVAALIASFVERVRLFHKSSSDPDLSELLDGLSPIGADLLAFRIALRWKQLTNQSRRTASYFVTLYFIGFFGLLGVALAAYIRAHFSA